MQATDRRKLLLQYVQEAEPSVIQSFEDAAAAQVVRALQGRARLGAGCGRAGWKEGMRCNKRAETISRQWILQNYVSPAFVLWPVLLPARPAQVAAMRTTVTNILGTLPPQFFRVSISSSGENLAQLMYSVSPGGSWSAGLPPPCAEKAHELLLRCCALAGDSTLALWRLRCHGNALPSEYAPAGEAF